MEVLSTIKGFNPGKYPPGLKVFSKEEHGDYFSGYSRPIRVEGDIHSLEVYGEIPKGISGAFYRIVAEPAFPPFFKDDIWINGDGMVSAFYIKDGHVDFKQRYVETEVLQACRQARQALLGKYRNKYTDRAEFRNRSLANVSIMPYRGKLLCTKEDSLPYVVDPRTLETFGDYNFEGQWESETFTAHSKYDTATRELCAFGYEAKGVMTLDNFYGVLDQHGKLTEKVWFKAPYVGFQHEMAITKNWVIFPIVPAKGNLERLKKGGEHWAWSYKDSHWFGVLPRRGAKTEDIKWFKGPNHFTAHVANAWEDEDGKIVLLITQSDENAFFWPENEGEEVLREVLGKAITRLVKYTLDPHSTDLTIPKFEPMLDEFCEFHKIDDRFMGVKSRYAYGVCNASPIDWDFVGPRWGGGYPPSNGLYNLDLDTGKVEKYDAGPRVFTQEPVFVPRTPDAPEGDGFLLALLSDYEENVGKLVILDTKKFTEAAAIIRLPLPLRPGVHGAWVDAADIDMHPLQPGAVQQ